MSVVKIYIDLREHSLIELLEKQQSQEFNNCIIKQNLDIGDVSFYIQQNEVLDCFLIVERKTVADLANSISSGRFREQKSRLLASGKRVMYLIEGNTNNYKDSKFTNVSATTLLSAIVNSLLRDNIQVYRTDSLEESCQFLLKIHEKLQEYGTSLVANLPVKDCGQLNKEYTEAINSTTKKDNLTPERAFVLQLCQIPKVSVSIATCIQANYKTMIGLVLAYNELVEKSKFAKQTELFPLQKPKRVPLAEKLKQRSLQPEFMLEGLEFAIANGKTRKIGSVVSELVYKFLFQIP